MLLLWLVAGGSVRAVASSLDALVALPAVQTALADADARREQFVEEWIRIAAIPAPSGREARRADYLEKRFQGLGLSSVARDAAGNVVGLLRGRDSSLKKVVFAAHMDTVALSGADYTVRRLPPEGDGVLKGPGVRDDSVGLAGLVAAVDLMRSHDLVPPADTWFVATVQEEVGLQGAERFVQDHASELGAYVAVDGQLGQISYAATGIVWLKLHFRGGAAHTLKAHEKPSAIRAAARAIDLIGGIQIRRSPEAMESWLNIGSMGAGEVPNAQPHEAWFTVDLRSNDPESLRALERKVLDFARQAAQGEGVEVETETLHRQAGASLPDGDRSTLVSATRGVLGALGWNRIEVTPRGTAEHNVAIARGIPGIAIGMTTGDGAHTPDEYADIAPFVIGLKQVMLLVLTQLTTAE